jgi:hypothetical protein
LLQPAFTLIPAYVDSAPMARRSARGRPRHIFTGTGDRSRVEKQSTGGERSDKRDAFSTLCGDFLLLFLPGLSHNILY